MGNILCINRQKDDLDLLGVSVYHLDNDFINEVRVEFPESPEDTKIYQIENLGNLDKNGIIREKGKDTTCPIDGRQGAAYVHTLQGDEHVGPASIMLSYTWGYSIGDIIDVLKNYCTTNNLNPKEVYVWICCLCVNQHRVIEKKRKGEVVPFEEFESVFSKRVTSIGHILAMMAPWTKPEYLFRVWCIFELFTASQTDGCKVTIEMPSREREDFIDGLVEMTSGGHIDKLFGVLSSTNVENAKASYESDRTNILNIVKSKTGYGKFNVTISTLIRKWVLQLIEDAAQSKRESVVDGEYDYDCARFHNQVGMIFYDLGENKLALDIANVLLKMIEKEFGSDHISMYFPLVIIADSLKSQGKYEEALNNYNKALTIAENNWGRVHEAVAGVLNGMGEAYQMQDEYDRAMYVLNLALAIRKENLGQDHRRTADTLSNIGKVLYDQGMLDEAMEKFQQAMLIYKEKCGSDSVDMAMLLGNIANILNHQSKYEIAMEKYNRCLAIQEKVLGTNHAETINSRENIENLKREMQI
jgi:tetratricopeptide (TPR) repeat protein